MSRERIYLFEDTEWFGYCNRFSTIEQVGNRTGTRHVLVPTLDSRFHRQRHRQCTSTLVCIYG